MVTDKPETITTQDMPEESPVREEPQIEEPGEELGDMPREARSPETSEEPKKSPATGLLAKSHVIQGEAIHYTPSWAAESPELDDVEDCQQFTHDSKFDDIKKVTLNNVDWKDDRTYLFGCPIPNGYNVTVAGITRTKPGTLKKPAYEVPLCDIFPAIVGHYTVKQFMDSNTSDNSFMKATSQTYVVVKWIDGGEIHTACVPQSAAMLKIELKKVLIGQFNMRLPETMIDDMTTYLNAFITTNMACDPQSTTFTRGQAASIIGFLDEACTVYTNGRSLFCDVDGELVIKDAVFVDSKNVNAARMIEPRGDPNVWTDAVREWLEYERIRFACYYMMSSILLSIFKLPPSVFGYICSTTYGKTFTQMVSASMHGNPSDAGDGLILGGDISLAAINVIFGVFKDFPGYIDESTITDDKVLDYLGYKIGNGSGGIRSTTTHTLADKTIIRSNVLMTGEDEFIKKYAPDGVQQRITIEKVPPLEKIEDNAKLCRLENTRHTICSNYGHILQPFIAAVYKHRGELQGVYDRSLDRLRNAEGLSIDAKRKATGFALANVAGFLLEPIFTSLKIPNRDPDAIVDLVWQECVITNKPPKQSENALADVRSFITSRANRSFLDHKKSNLRMKDKLVGWFGNPKIGQYVDIERVILETYLEERGYKNVRSIEEKWHDGEIIIPSNAKGLARSVKHIIDASGTSMQVTVLRFNLDKLNADCDSESGDDCDRVAPQNWADLIRMCAVAEQQAADEAEEKLRCEVLESEFN